ncbi:metallophosphoesterase [Caminibacter mediatlanticus TB-2]|uniref:Metallophosphoesterase n=1 Tax=Caminibacter mediatlanticus TB-2 TaxID=391592 RepID=A0ABX5V9Q7_9BACT|nr:metallophosphoesterase family protein [Caminibacter mediatlanticus]QCT95030.1 metallophosphoesterase [Caminibacter mediatlanticus TB-2]
MELVHLTDLHFNIKWFEWLKKNEKNYDIFCITGDFLDETKDNIKYQKDYIRKFIKDFSSLLFVCSGNHDDDIEWLYFEKDNYYFDNCKKEINGIKIGSFPYLGGNIYDFYDCDILLTHIPPKNTKTSIDKNTLKDYGDFEIYYAIKNGFSPKFILSGHIHNPLKTKDKLNSTIIYNPGLNKHIIKNI